MQFEYVRGDRRLELHFRHSLGLVAYHVGEEALTHEDYMRAVLGPRRENKYPGFSSDPLDAFRDLAHDLEHHALGFLSGPDEDFTRCVERLKESPRPTGFGALSCDEPV